MSDKMTSGKGPNLQGHAHAVDENLELLNNFKDQKKKMVMVSAKSKNSSRTLLFS